MFYRDLRVVTVDGFTLDVTDTPANAESFARGANGPASANPYPQLRALPLAELRHPPPAGRRVRARHHRGADPGHRPDGSTGRDARPPGMGPRSLAVDTLTTKVYEPDNKTSRA